MLLYKSIGEEFLQLGRVRKKCYNSSESWFLQEFHRDHYRARTSIKTEELMKKTQLGFFRKVKHEDIKKSQIWQKFLV
jgi:hypothetical protein